MVELSSWAETISKHPLKYKFEGLDGFHTTVVAAAKCSSSFWDKTRDQIEAGEHAELEKAMTSASEEAWDVLEQYLCFLRGLLHISDISDLDVSGRVRTICLEGTEADLQDITAPELRDAASALETLVRSGPCPRDQFAGTSADIDLEFAMEDLDEEYLLEEHPPIEVFDSAYEEGIPLEAVVFLCPSCGRQPETADHLEDRCGRFYCGRCGAEYLDREADLRKEEDLQTFLDTFSLTKYPFKCDRPTPSTSS